MSGSRGDNPSATRSTQHAPRGTRTGPRHTMPHDPVTAHLRHLTLLGRSPASIYARERALARMTAYMHVTLLDAQPPDLARWRENLAVTPDTVIAYVSHATGFYTWAVTTGLLKTSPAAGLPVPRMSRRLPRPISEPDLLTALEHAPPRIRPWLVLAAWAGLRAKEIAYLRRENVLEASRPPVLLVAGDATKGHRERIVPMSGFVTGELAVHGLPGAGFVFRRRDGRAGPNQPWLVSHLCNEHLHACGVTATLHQLRHRFLTQAYAVGHDLRLVQELAGHASITSTTGYVAYDSGAAVLAVEAIPAPGRLRVVSDG